MELNSGTQTISNCPACGSRVVEEVTTMPRWRCCECGRCWALNEGTQGPALRLVDPSICDVRCTAHHLCRALLAQREAQSQPPWD